MRTILAIICGIFGTLTYQDPEKAFDTSEKVYAIAKQIVINGVQQAKAGDLGR